MKRPIGIFRKEDENACSSMHAAAVFNALRKSIEVWKGLNT
jgi:hypothetical protein